MSAALDQGLEVTALHNHFFCLLFLHYWGVGRTDELAKGLRAALDQTHHDAMPPR